MGHLNSDQTKERVYHRILQTIAAKKRRTRRRYALVTVLGLGVLCCLTYWRFDFSVSPSSPIERQLYADISAGSVSINGAETKSIQEIQTNNELPIRIQRDSDMVIIQSDRSRQSKTDEVVLRVGVGGLYKVILDDGSNVFLNSNSELRYRGDLRENRRVEVRGEAYFEVAQKQTATRDHPFTVITKGQEIQVLGTKFNVVSRGGNEQTVLTEGSINLKSIKNGEQNTLSPGEMVRLTATGSLVKSSVSVDEYTAWKDGIIYFEDRSLRDILNALKHIYPIEFRTAAVPAKNFTVYLKRDRPFSDILTMLKESGQLEVRLKDTELIFSK